MRYLIRRNLKLYFSNRSGMFFSLMGALISFVLYLVFLKQNMLSSWEQVPQTKLILDPWLIGGTLAVTAVTTTANGLGQMIRDRESGTLADLALTDVSYIGLQISYLISSVVIGTLMQLVMFVGMTGYFGITDHIKFSVTIVLPIIMIAIISSVVWTIFNLIILSFVKNVDTLGKIGTILGTSAGFFAGIYLPIGMVPKFAQTLMKLTPAPYNAALYRQVLMHEQLKISFQDATSDVQTTFEKMMGVGVEINRLTTWQQNIIVLLLFAVAFGIVTLVLMKGARRTGLSHV